MWQLYIYHHLLQRILVASSNKKIIEKLIKKYAAIAQLVEQGTENPCVLGSIPSCGIFFLVKVFAHLYLCYK